MGQLFRDGDHIRSFVVMMVQGSADGSSWAGGDLIFNVSSPTGHIIIAAKHC